ncbi:MAG: hypothetical protein AAF363_14705 [Bacteroidota bacterium]
MDLKSFLIGMLLTACIFLSISSSQTSDNRSRYQLVPDEQVYGFANVIDTYTGAVIHIKMNKALKTEKEYITAQKIQQLLESKN